MRLERVLSVLKTIRLRQAGMSERDIQDMVSLALVRAGIPHRCEVKIAPHCRVDFLLDDGIVIELKKLRPERGTVEQQIGRYARIGDVTAIVLLLERSIRLPAEIDGKPVRVVSLNSNWGIAT